MVVYGQEVKGQGVGSAYEEMVQLLENHARNELQISINNSKDAQLNHIHTIHPSCFFQMFTSSLPNCMHVHFLPETIEGSIKLPDFIQSAYYDYVIKMYQKANELIVVNPIFIDDLVKYDIPRENISYIPNVVASDRFFPKDIPADDPLRKKYHMPKDCFNVISVGQVQTRKGVLDFIDIAKMMPDVNFLWVGGFSFGRVTDGYEELEKIANNPPKNVHFLGIIDRDQMNTIYNMADLLLMTSYNELFPMSILEAVNAKRPILLRDLDLYEKIYFTDYLKAKNSNEFVDLIYKLRDDPLTQERAKKASEDISTFYSEEYVAKLWIEYYRRIHQKWS